MKLYKNIGGRVNHRAYGISMHGSSECTIGVIAEKKVDDFNGMIKVYQSIGTLETQPMGWFRNDTYDVCIFDRFDDTYVHLSECKLEEVTDEERAAVLEKLQKEVDDHLGKASEVKKLIKDLEG